MAGFFSLFIYFYTKKRQKYYK